MVLGIMHLYMVYLAIKCSTKKTDKLKKYNIPRTEMVLSNV